MEAHPQALPSATLGGGRTMEPAWALALAASFGSVERWREEFVVLGRAAGGGSGRVVLAFQPHAGRLVHQRAADPAQVLAGSVPLLALDIDALAARRDDGAAAGAGMDLIDWRPVHAAYRAAVHAASEALGRAPGDCGDAQLLDVRRAAIHEQAATQIPNARWRDPARIDAWSRELDPERAVVVYCAQGHEVSRAAALRLRAAGLDARFLCGGIEGWQAAGLPLQHKQGAA